MSIKLQQFYTSLSLIKVYKISDQIKNKFKQQVFFFNMFNKTPKNKKTTYYKTLRKNLGYPINGQRTHSNAKMSFFKKNYYKK